MRWEDNNDVDGEGGLEEVEIPLPFVAQLDPALLIDSIKSIRIRFGAFKAQPSQTYETGSNLDLIER